MKTIIWSEEFYLDVAEIVKYLVDNWGLSTADNFINEINEKSAILASYPDLGRPSKKAPAIRKIIISKNNWLYYKISDEAIIFARVISQKKNPLSNPFE